MWHCKHPKKTFSCVVWSLVSAYVLLGVFGIERWPLQRGPLHSLNHVVENLNVQLAQARSDALCLQHLPTLVVSPEIKTSKFDFRLLVIKGDMISEGIKSSGDWDLHVTAAIQLHAGENCA